MIPKVIFKFDREKDLKNIWATCNVKQADYGTDFKKLVTKNILKICEGKKYGECKKELKETMNQIHQNPVIEIIVESFNKSWRKIDKEYFRRLESIFGASLKVKEIPVYLTNSAMCMYDPDKKSQSFFSILYGNVFWTLNSAMHELMHIQFHNSKYWKLCEKEIGRKKTFDLKEALTILLNLEFNDLMVGEDEGYPDHIKLRKFIEKQWKKKKDFNILIDESIKWMKNN